LLCAFARRNGIAALRCHIPFEIPIHARSRIQSTLPTFAFVFVQTSTELPEGEGLMIHPVLLSSLCHCTQHQGNMATSLEQHSFSLKNVQPRDVTKKMRCPGFGSLDPRRL
jgi:hypothetical protein